VSTQRRGDEADEGDLSDENAKVVEGDDTALTRNVGGDEGDQSDENAKVIKINDKVTT
jgi:hypothetical protein